ncbi:MAG TPA: glycoside hydrolase domain-containing protein [Bacteroidales bacterium]
MRLSLFVFIAFCMSVFAGTPVTNLPTTVAVEKYAHLLKNKSFFIFPELRNEPIKWFDSIPEGKIKNAFPEKNFTISAQPGEFYVYQLGFWALRKDVGNVQIEFTDLKGKNGKAVPGTRMTCFNKGGIDFRGNPFSKEIKVTGGRIQALWIGIDLEGVGEGNYTGSVSVLANGERQTVPLLLKVGGEVVPNHGYNEGYRLSRLNWLNSTVGIDEEITKGYLPVKVEGNRISILGRMLNISENGLPASITSYFSPSNQSLVETGEPVVNHPFRFIVEKENGEIVRLVPGKLTFRDNTPSKVVWSVLNTSNELELECTGQIEFDGFVDYRLKLTAKVPLKVKDIRLEIPLVKEKAEYMMGLGHEGGLRTPDWKWKWDVTKNQDMLWTGAVNGGLRVKWKAENYVRPLVNIYYEFGPLNLPPSWGNEGKGGVNVGQQNSDVVINAYSGTREMKSGEKLNYDFELLITPFRVIDRQNKFGDRYYHGGGPNSSLKIENAKKAGANIINIHHAEDIYPFINYPYLDANAQALNQLVANAHKENLRMKFYYTTRELTKNLPEFWAFNSLNGEIIFPGPGNATRTEALHPKGPNEWYIKNLREKYIPAWYNTIKEGKFKGETDLSVITTPDSRLNNFYIGGLDWMVQNLGIDGVYIDDSALDHYTLRRARKVIDRYRPEGRMDLHSWNHFNKWAGFANCLNLYMDLLPYFDLVWIGEGRDYNRMPDHWLIEVSGIPFGLTGQMLEGGGNPWRGMVYGITNRAGWTPNPPSDIWKFWDDYKIKDKIMIGYWEKDCPVTCSNPLIKASVYKSADEVIISVANWTDKDKEVSITIDWAKLGIDPARFDIIIPELKDFQTEKTDVSLNKITIPGKEGYLILLKRKNN